MPKVFFVQEHREIEVEPGRTIKDIALSLGIDPNRRYQRLLSCDGRGIFDGCKCWVKDLGSVEHEVAAGESASSIAAKYDTTAKALLALNGLDEAGIKPGTKVKIPALSAPSFTERALHGVAGWQRLACQAKVLRGDVQVWTLPMGVAMHSIENLAARAGNPDKRERFLESRFKKPVVEEEEKPKKAVPAKAKPAAAAKPADAAAKPAEGDAKPAEEAKTDAAAKPAPKVAKPIVQPKAEATEATATVDEAPAAKAAKAEAKAEEPKPEAKAEAKAEEPKAEAKDEKPAGA